MAEDSPAVDFPTPSMDDWRAAAEKALRGKPLESVTWRTDDGFELPPVLAESPARTVLPSGGPVRVAAYVLGDPDGSLAEDVREELESGADLIVFDEEIALDRIPQTLAAEATLLQSGFDAESFARRAAHVLDGRAGGIVLATLCDGECAASQIAQIVGHGLRLVLSQALADASITASAIVPRLVLRVPVTAELLTEIAKLRALRSAWREALLAFGVTGADETQFLAEVSMSTATRLEPHTNLLRFALGAFAALCGGAAVIEPTAYDAAAGGSSGATGTRLAVNQIRLLTDEAFAARVEDPTAGSYLIETLTHRFSALAMEYLYASDSDAGGARTRSEIEHRWTETVDARDLAVRRRERTVVGLNRFAEPTPDASHSPDFVRASLYDGEDDESVLDHDSRHVPGRFEWLRERVVSHMEGGNARPSAILLSLGDARVRRIRAGFAADFFRCGGFDVADPWGFDTVDDALAAATDARAVIVCADDATYPESVPAIAAALPDVLIYVAGKPIDGLDVTGFVYQGVDAVDVLSDALDRLGVERVP